MFGNIGEAFGNVGSNLKQLKQYFTATAIFQGVLAAVVTIEIFRRWRNKK